MTKELQEIEQEIIRLKEKRTEIRKREPREAIQNYTLQGPGDAVVTLSELFGERSDLLVIHNMGKGCPYCTLWADGLNGLLPHLEDRTAVVLVSPNAPQVQAEFAAGRGWGFRMISAQNSPFTKDMGFAMEDGGSGPGASAFHKNADGSIERTGSTWFGPGDDYCSTWPLFEMLADGIHDWEPKYQYNPSPAAASA
ncbi:MAG: hypothetical protein JWN14_5029 [Chthonomonadales bacterium]|nr:hypothetical protein [Chthonomonadales bacterium]